MSDRPSRILLAVLLAFGTIGVSTQPAHRPGDGRDGTGRGRRRGVSRDARPGQRAKANIDLNDKTRTVWSNLPVGMTMQVGATERNGLKLGDMTPAQEKAALALVATTLSREGYQKAMDIVDADQVLETRSAPTRKPGAPIRFGRAVLLRRILGKPSTTDTWMLQFGGHHLAINVTFAGRENVLTPTHTGAQPATYTRGRPDGASAGRRERQGVRAHQRAQCRAAEAGDSRLRGAQPRARPGRRRQDDRARRRSRVDLHAAQRAMLLDLVREWVGILGDEAAAAKMKESQGGSRATRTSRGPVRRPTARAPISGFRGRRCSSSTRRRGRRHQHRPHPHDLSRSRPTITRHRMGKR